jgi:DNA repair protein RecN (Recombination protein N)
MTCRPCWRAGRRDWPSSVKTADLAALAARRRCRRARNMNSLRSALSGKRAKAAEALGREVSQVMQQLALGWRPLRAWFAAGRRGNAAGLEQVEFRIAGLAGSEPRPLAKVASGGELSRISLAIQVVTSQAASVPTLIFDEVDVGIGGGVAEVVGRLLRELGANDRFFV